MRDFILRALHELLITLINQGYQFQSISNYFTNAATKVVLLRHDIDAVPENALAFARIEQEMGLTGTFYFRALDKVFLPETIKDVVACGHEIGYHYEEMDLCDGDHTGAFEMFKKNLEQFRRLYPVSSICMHGSPMSRYDNKDLWKKYDYHEFGIIAEPYFDIDWNEVFYLTDTGRRWDGEKYSVRDKIGDPKSKSARQKKRRNGKAECGKLQQAKLEIGNFKSNVPDRAGDWYFDPLRFHSTFDIIGAAEAGQLPDKIMFTFHPQRWHDRWLPWTKELVWQNCKNVAKYGMGRWNARKS